MSCLLAWDCVVCHTERLSERIYNKGINVIPAPELMEQGKGMFVLDEDVTIGVSHDSILPVASFYAQKMRVSTGYGLPLEESGAIRLSIDKTVAGDEAYRLSVTPDGVDVRASSLRGLFYGMATFMQLLPAEIESTACVDGVEWTVPEVEVVDSPRFPYRGLMLDVTPPLHFRRGVEKAHGHVGFGKNQYTASSSQRLSGLEGGNQEISPAYRSRCPAY